VSGFIIVDSVQKAEITETKTTVAFRTRDNKEAEEKGDDDDDDEE